MTGLRDLVKRWRTNAYESSDVPYCAGLGEAADDVEAMLDRDPADDAAWPLPEGWRWAQADDIQVVCGPAGISAWIAGGGVTAHVPKWPIPLAVVRTLLARWEAGQP